MEISDAALQHTWIVQAALEMRSPAKPKGSVCSQGSLAVSQWNWQPYHLMLGSCAGGSECWSWWHAGALKPSTHANTVGYALQIMVSHSVSDTLLLWGAYDNRQGLETGYSTIYDSCTYVSLLHKKHFPQTYFPICTGQNPADGMEERHA